jgi:hypothetical protein
VLDHDDRVGAIGHGSAGHDLDGFPSGDRAGESFARTDFTDDAETPGHVGGADGEAVADGSGESWGVAVGGDVFR